MNKDLKLRIKQAIRSTGLSHAEIATKMGMNEYDISNISAGRKKITIEFALDLEKHFYINPCWLFFGRERMTANFNLDGTGVKNLTNEEISAQLRYLTEKVKEMENE